jgi:hypothetical protein
MSFTMYPAIITALLLLHRCCRYPLLKGDTDLLKLLKLLQPKVLVPLLNADLDQEGKLTALMSVRGSSIAADVRRQLAAAGGWHMWRNLFKALIALQLVVLVVSAAGNL